MIIKCPECGHQVSDKAPFCPSCGVKIAGHIVTCSNCDEIYLKEDYICPNCHHAETETLHRSEEQTIIVETPHNEDTPIVEIAEDVEKEKVTNLNNSEEAVAETSQNNDEVPLVEATEDEPLAAVVVEDNEQVVYAEEIQPIEAQSETENPKEKATNNHVPLIISLLLAIIISAVLLFFYHRGNQNHEAEDYEIALKSNNIDVMEQFINDYPDAPLAHLTNIKNLLAQSKSEDEGWGKAVQQNSIVGYKTYLQAHPNTPHKAEILSRIDELSWQEAVRFNNEASYLGYREKFPSGVHAKEADEKLKVLLDNTASAADTQTAKSVIRQFLQGINSKSSSKIKETVAAQFTFLGTSGATTADVDRYMRERLYQADVKNVMWHLGKDATATTDKTADGRIVHTVTIPARLEIEREGGTSSKNYSVRATIENNRIVAINWTQQAATPQPTAQ